MKRRVIAILAVACCGAGGQAVVAAPSARPAAQVASACTYARIGGKTKCLMPGEYCARRYQNQYRHYGFTCSKLDRRGHWHLEYA
jgi:hypothetical protein